MIRNREKKRKMVDERKLCIGKGKDVLQHIHSVFRISVAYLMLLSPWRNETKQTNIKKICAIFKECSVTIGIVYFIFTSLSGNQIMIWENSCLILSE